MTGTGEGFGKLILFGEHFVVHNIPGIVAGLNDKTTARVEAVTEGWELDDQRPETPGYKDEKEIMMFDSLKRIFTEMKIDPEKTPIKITLGGNLLAASGVGASAASCAAIARALARHFTLDDSVERINEIAFEGEKGYHGKPSGIDNTAATYGGILWFIKGNPNVIKPITVKTPVQIVMGYTGITGDTKKAVLGVADRREKDPATYDPIFVEAEQLMKDARTAIEEGNISHLAQLANKNHELLQKIGVSSPKLEELVDIARDAGAIGAKMTGGGLGGYMFAIARNPESQKEIYSALKEKGYHAIATTVG